MDSWFSIKEQVLTALQPHSRKHCYIFPRNPSVHLKTSRSCAQACAIPASFPLWDPSGTKGFVTAKITMNWGRGENGGHRYSLGLTLTFSAKSGHPQLFITQTSITKS